MVWKRAAAAMPTRPVPAPSSRMRGHVGVGLGSCGSGEVEAGLWLDLTMPGKWRGRRSGRRLARR